MRLDRKEETMIYQELLNQLLSFSKERLLQTVTVELGIEDECFTADLRICGSDHDSLDEGRVVLYVEDA